MRFSFLILIVLLTVTACGENDVDFPWVFEDSAQGCSEFIIYRLSETDDIALFIRIDQDLLGLVPGFYEFDLDQNPAGVNVNIHQFDESAAGYYCSEEPSAARIIRTWEGLDGSLFLTIGQSSADGYLVSASLDNVIFVLDDESHTLNSMTMNDILVGWYPTGP